MIEFMVIYGFYSVDCGKFIPSIVDSAEEETDGDGRGDYGVSAVSCLCIFKRGLLRFHPT